MSKLRVHDMAGEFGISNEEVINLLRSMDVPVRSHLSLLTDDQVARARARWEREKRHRAEKQAAGSAPATTRRRRSAAAPEPTSTAPTYVPEPGAVRRRRRANVQAAEAAQAEAADAAEATESAAAESAAVDSAEPEAPDATPASKAPAPAAEKEAAPEADRPVETKPVVEPAAEKKTAGRAAAPPAEDVPDAGKPARAADTEAPAAEAEAAAPSRPRSVAPRPAAARTEEAEVSKASPAASATPADTKAPDAEERPARKDESRAAAPARQQPQRPAASATPPQAPSRPRPASPSTAGVPPRPRPVASSSGYVPPRPVASAAPGSATTMPGRRGQGAGTGTGAGTGAGTDKGGRRGRKGRRGSVDQEAVSSNISRTMSALRGSGGGRRGRRSADSGPSREELAAMRAAEAERERLTIRVNEFVTVSELADIIKVPATQIVAFAFKTLGLMVTINQRLDFDQIDLIANEFGFEAVREEEYASDLAEVVSEEDAPESLVPRPPVVTIMGHVDHGKTSLLDYIRRANVVAGESGGITQHIGAYHVQLPDGRLITFLDTPGHEAFTAMRARGAQVTDTVVLVVAADDQVMPQTVEAISHARNAGVPIVVAINKIDLPSADVAKVKQELLQHNVVVEEFGGDTLATEISAKKGINVDQLLEQILLQAEILDLKANPDRNATGVVVEAQLDPGKGPVATVLVQSGTLKVGDDFIVGLHAGRVRALLDERGRSVEKAGPAIPVQVLGLSGVPMAGDQFIVVDDSQTAREIAGRRERLDREARSRRTSKSAVTLEDFMAQAQAGEVQSLRLLIKADQGGPAEALADALQQLSNDEVRVEVIHRGVGAISESDILLAKASGAVIIGFHVRPDNNARAAAEREGVDVKLYRVIYDAVTDVRAALEGLLSPEQREVVLGEAEVRDTFKVPRAGTIAGCFVRSGIIVRNGRARVIRDGVEIYDGSIESLRRFKDDVREVREGYECGIGIENFNDIKVGDVIECYRTEEVARTLDSAASSHQG